MKEQIEKQAIMEMADEIRRIRESYFGQADYLFAKKLFEDGYRKQEWISVEDRLPDVGDSYIVVVKLKYEWETEWEYDTDVAAFVFFDGYIDGVWDTFTDWNEGQECHITHWMPIPEPPKMKGGAE